MLPQRPTSGTGTFSGLLAGTLLSVSYCLFVLLNQNTNLFSSSNFGDSVPAMLIVLFIAFTIGAGIGSLGGLIIGAILFNFVTPIGPFFAALIGISVAAFSVLILNLILHLPLQSLCDWNNYLQIAGFPGLICICGGGWIGVQWNHFHQQFFRSYISTSGLLNELPKEPVKRDNELLIVVFSIGLVLTYVISIYSTGLAFWVYVIAGLVGGVGSVRKSRLFAIVLILSVLLLVIMRWLSQFNYDCTAQFNIGGD